MRLTDVPWLPFLFAALCGWFGYRIGYDTGLRTERTRTAVAAVTLARTNSAIAKRTTMAERNVVWRTLNGDAAPDVPARSLAHVLIGLLHREAQEEQRFFGLTGFRRKAEAYLGALERETFPQIFDTRSRYEVAEALRILTDHDARASRLLQEILADRTRVDAFMNGARVPLEQMDDGSEP